MRGNKIKIYRNIYNYNYQLWTIKCKVWSLLESLPSKNKISPAHFYSTKKVTAERINFLFFTLRFISLRKNESNVVVFMLMIDKSINRKYENKYKICTL